MNKVRELLAKLKQKLLDLLDKVKVYFEPKAVAEVEKEFMDYKYSIAFVDVDKGGPQDCCEEHGLVPFTKDLQEALDFSDKNPSVPKSLKKKKPKKKLVKKKNPKKKK